ncbi:MAG: hypothetical protein H8E40_12635 [Chloroflexi bacterium]|nr:hypothetical protein [Chloroflexota bacterium]
MKCTEPLTVSQLKELISEGSWSDSALQVVLDSAVDFLFSLLGHSFGKALRIYHDESDDATAATVEATSTGIVLVITGGANAGTTTYLFADYADLTAMVDAIEQADIGFIVSLVEGISPTEKSENLHTLSAIGCLGLSNRQVLCIQYMTETMDGTGESHIFTKLPLRAIVSILQDGTTVTSSYYWDKTLGYIVYKYAVGSKYSKYTTDMWSLRSPCNIVVKYTPLWLRTPGFFKLILRAMCQHTIAAGAMKSESIGDYSYQLGDIQSIIAPWWPMIAEYSVSFSP